MDDDARSRKRANARRYYERHREELLAKAKTIYRDRRRETMRRLYEERREEIKERSRRWYKANKERGEETRRSWAARHPEQMLEYKRAYELRNIDKNLDRRLRASFGISLDNYNQMLEVQGGVCAICGRAGQGRDGRGVNPDKPRRLCVDHDHATGAVRGLLCGWCNRTLGRFDNDAERFEKAAAYLRTATKVV